MGFGKDELNDFDYTDMNFSNDRIEHMKGLYNIAKEAKVGTVVKCPTCQTPHTKTTYHNVFCPKVQNNRSSCKDKYWNSVDEKWNRLI